MKIPITKSYSGIISTTLARTGGLILFRMLYEASIRAESLLEKDSIPEEKRIGTKYSHVVASKEGSYCFTMEREPNNIWTLISFQQEETPKEALACQ